MRKGVSDHARCGARGEARRAMSTLSSRKSATESSAAGALRARGAGGAVSGAAAAAARLGGRVPPVALQTREKVVHHLAHEEHVLVQPQAVDNEPVAAVRQAGRGASGAERVSGG